MLFSADTAERSAVFRGIRACMFEAAQPQVASPPEKPCRVREVWRSQTCARSRLSLLPFFGEAKKGSACADTRRKGKQNIHGAGYLKTKTSLAYFQLLKSFAFRRPLLIPHLSTTKPRPAGRFARRLPAWRGSAGADSRQRGRYADGAARRWG